MKKKQGYVQEVSRMRNKIDYKKKDMFGLTYDENFKIADMWESEDRASYKSHLILVHHGTLLYSFPITGITKEELDDMKEIMSRAENVPIDEIEIGVE
jgi:hypothetical protein